MSELSQEEIRRRRLARLAALGGTGPSPTTTSPPVTPSASVPSDAISPSQPNRKSPSPRTSAENTPKNINNEENYTESTNEVSEQNQIPAVGLIVTEKTENLLEEISDTKMTDLSQTRQYNSFDSMGDDALLTCGSVRVGPLPQSTVTGSEGVSNREDSTSRSISPPQFVEPSPVRQRTNNASPSCSRRSLSMEVDDVSERNSQSDTQQEPMEVEDGDSLQSPARKIQRSRTISSTEMTEEQLRSIIANILQTSWSEECTGGTFAPSVAASLLDNPNISLEELASQAIMDVIGQISDGSDPLNYKPLVAVLTRDSMKELSEENDDDPLAKDPSTIKPEVEEGECPKPSLPLPKDIPSQSLAVSYLAKFYYNINIYERDYPKKSSEPPLSDLLLNLRKIIVDHLILVLRGQFGLVKSRKSPLLPYVMLCITPLGLLSELLRAIYQDQDALEEVFVPLLMGIREEMRRRVSPLICSGEGAALRALRALCELRAGPRHSARPICALIAKLPSLCPAPVTTAPGREIARVSFLGPFFAMSLFAEENPLFAERMFASGTDQSLAFALQREVEASRNTLHNICHNILLCPEAREPFLLYFAALLQRNERRAQMQTDERSLAGDGFMLNVCSVLQLLSVRIKMDRVYPLYTFQPGTWLNIRDETRLYFTAQEAQDWLDSLNKDPSHTWPEAKFQTVCWFLTLHMHHVALIPALNTHQRRIRAFRDLQKVIEELVAAEPQWRNSMNAMRNRELLLRWKRQIKRLHRSKQCAETALLDPDLMRRGVQFYSSVCALLVKQLEAAARAPRDQPSSSDHAFRATPEWYVEDIAEFMLFAVQYVPQIVAYSIEDPIITWLLSAICHSHLIKNPYLVAKIVEVLFVINLSLPMKLKNVYEKFMDHPMSQTALPSALMKFYTDIETTGQSTEFYDKFTIRFHIIYQHADERHHIPTGRMSHVLETHPRGAGGRERKSGRGSTKPCACAGRETVPLISHAGERDGRHVGVPDGRD
ncbi:unnamed protein product [Leptidea sinapis]|uniref:Ubiquitin conjugation factor E4 core domain-containing protein n=1 Tax=Leptidea sinapis TaxID=189913 RepID=A0A5E4PQV7_9NEOP|nr:unnamed protein product [Leptidea sinapis]